MNTKIQWTNKTWNPIVGCSKISPGCRECYAEKMAKRLCAMGQGPYFPVVSPNGWTGETNFIESALKNPFRWKKPSMVFVCSMSDLFHENNAIDDIAAVFATMYLNPRHTFQILTKRPEIAKSVLNDERFWGYYHAECNRLHSKYIGPMGQELYFYSEVREEWPLNNVWFGVTAENQKMANERIPILLQIPATKRFVSIEPMLEPIDMNIDIDPSRWSGYTKRNLLSGFLSNDTRESICANPVGHLDWIICGSESGPKRRDFYFNWAVSLRDQCVAAGVPFFFKQMYHSGKKISMPTIDGVTWSQIPER